VAYNPMVNANPRTKFYQLNVLAASASLWVFYAVLRLALARFYASGSWTRTMIDTVGGSILVLFIVLVMAVPYELDKMIASEHFPTAEKLFRGVPYLCCLLISSLIGCAWFLSRPRYVPESSATFYCAATLAGCCPPAFRTWFIVANLTTVVAALLVWRITLNRDFLAWALIGFLALSRLTQANRENMATAAIK
jgi:hypothetical protein